jgi:hypothetical protein
MNASMNTSDEENPRSPRTTMTKLTVDQDIKLGSALDHLEDIVEAAYASLRMVKWTKLNVARSAGGILVVKIRQRSPTYKPSTRRGRVAFECSKC